MGLIHLAQKLDKALQSTNQKAGYIINLGVLINKLDISMSFLHISIIMLAIMRNS